MSFRLSRALAVYRKDVLELRKNRGLLLSLLAMPAVMVAVPVGVVWMYAREAARHELRTVALFYDPSLPLSADPARFLVERSLTDWLALFLVMPVFVPVLIASGSIAGEKERRTLEPLLASPVSAAELLLGKSLAALVPAVLVTWAAFAVLCVGVDWAAWPLYGRPLLPDGLWAFGVLVLAPLFAFLGNGVAVLVSARVGDSRLAQQLSALVVLPLVGLAASQVAGWLDAGPAYYALQGLGVAALDVALVRLGTRLFDRDRLVSRWG